VKTWLHSAEDWLWQDDRHGARLERTLRALAQYGFAIGQDIARGDLSLRAASLVYTTMLALVPLLALSFSVLKGLGFHRQLEPLLLNFFAPLGAQGEELTSRIIGFVDNVQGSILASVSVGMLLFTTLSMAQKVERSVNFVWQVDQPKSFVRRSSEYASLMLAGPIVGTAAIGLIAMISNTALVARLRDLQPLGTLFALGSALAPYLIIIAAFTFLYAFLPNTRVRLGSALVGGVIAGVLWVLSGYLFAGFVDSAGQTQLIYSGFAAIIAAMLWLYLSWLVLLVGAQIAFYHQHPNWRRRSWQGGRSFSASSAQLALGLMWSVASLFRQTRRDTSLDGLARRLNVSPERLRPVTEALRQAELLAVTGDQEFVPARDPRSILVADILSAARAPIIDWPGLRDSPLPALLDSLAHRMSEAVGDLRLEDLLDPDPEAPQKSRAVQPD
jgi:membrane protein